MFSFRGDAHKIFLSVKEKKDIESNKMLKEASKIKSFYETLDSKVLRLIYYRMIKEQNGMGIIPIFVSSVPWLLFLMSDKIQEFLFKDRIILWVFILLYLIVLTISTIFHFKSRAWAALHIEMIKDVLGERDKDRE